MILNSVMHTTTLYFNDWGLIFMKQIIKQEHSEDADLRQSSSLTPIVRICDLES